MFYYLVKIAITSIVIVTISEIAKRSTFLGALLASLPLISIFAMLWLYIDTKDVVRVSTFATSVFWLVLPTLPLFVALPLLLKQGLHFYLSIGLSVGLTVVCYWLMITTLNHYGVKL